MLLGDADVEDPLRVSARRTCAGRPGCSIAAVMPTTSGRSSPIWTISSAKTSVQTVPATANGSAGLRVDDADLRGTGPPRRSGRLVAVALAGDRVHDHRAAEALARRSAASTAVDVVAVDRADVLQAEVLEHALRGDDVLEALLHRRAASRRSRRPTTGVRSSVLLAPVEERS